MSCSRDLHDCFILTREQQGENFSGLQKRHSVRLTRSIQFPLRRQLTRIKIRWYPPRDQLGKLDRRTRKRLILWYGESQGEPGRLHPTI